MFVPGFRCVPSEVAKVSALLELVQFSLGFVLFWGLQKGRRKRVNFIRGNAKRKKELQEQKQKQEQRSNNQKNGKKSRPRSVLVLAWLNFFDFAQARARCVL